MAALAGARLRFTALGWQGADHNQEILVNVFLRGGCDALNLVPPVAGDDRGYYEAARSELQIPASGPDGALTLDGHLGLHPVAGAIHALYQDGVLAIVRAAGMHEDTRSHFDAQAYMELGTPGSTSSTTGWITRHLQSATNLPDEIMMPVLAMGNMQPACLRGNWDAVAMRSTGSFNLDTGPWRWRDAQRYALRQLYSDGPTWLHQAGVQALNAVDIIEVNDPGTYQPSNGAVYPSGSFGDQLKVIAQMIKLRLGLCVATIDMGGWDTHRSQGTGATGTFANLVGNLSQGLAALYTDLDGSGDDNYTQRLMVVVMSEFGRRLRENDDVGTDHGHGGVMLVLGGSVNGGLFGDWPGLHHDQLYDGADLDVTTDYRRVLCEILIRRLGNPYLGTIFPGFTDYVPLGVVQGEDLPPVYSSPYSVYLPLVVRQESASSQAICPPTMPLLEGYVERP
jgi:uncharacterized protein (DUF1501 family)